MDLEKPNCHVVIIDIRQDVSLRIINVYRSFRPHGMSPLKLFETQLNIMQNAITSNCFILGDFNLDARMEGVNTYNYKQLLYNLTNFATENNFQQIIDFSTWSRVINGVRKESLLDHVYVNCLVLIKDVQQVEPVFGDHVLATVELHSRSIEKTKEIFKRNWKGYTSEKFNQLLSGALGLLNLVWDDLNVQEHWNVLENCIINTIDCLAPLEE